MQFRIPQFLDIEDQVFGPFTFKQFGYILGAVAFAYLFWKLIPYTIISIFFILIFSGTFIALAFVKVNSRPFADVLESAYKYIIGDKTFIWKNNKDSRKKKEEIEEKIKEIEILEKESLNFSIKNISKEKINELSKKLDVLENEDKISLRDHLLKKVGKNNI